MAVSSARPGMGAVPYAGGATFRVWAPFASDVAVAGSFNGWRPGTTPLGRDGDSGYWSCDVPGVAVGDQYKFVLRNPGILLPFWKNDPYARELTNSVGNSILAETGAVASIPGYATPPWNEMVIYELHVGSFRFDPGSANGRGDFDTVIGQLDYPTASAGASRCRNRCRPARRRSRSGSTPTGAATARCSPVTRASISTRAAPTRRTACRAAGRSASAPAPA